MRLVGRSEYKLRVGDYRVIADIEENSRVIIIRSLGHNEYLQVISPFNIIYFYNQESQLQLEWTGRDSANALGEYYKTSQFNPHDNLSTIPQSPYICLTASSRFCGILVLLSEYFSIAA